MDGPVCAGCMQSLAYCICGEMSSGSEEAPGPTSCESPLVPAMPQHEDNYITARIHKGNEVIVDIHDLLKYTGVRIECNALRTSDDS